MTKHYQHLATLVNSKQQILNESWKCVLHLMYLYSYDYSAEEGYLAC